MKRITLVMLSMLLTLTVSCQNASNQFTISGTTFDNTKRVHLRMVGNTLCKAKVRDGKFAMTGSVDSICIAYFSEDDYIGLPLVLEPGISVTIDEPRNLVSGTALNDQLYRYEKPRQDWYVETCRVVDSLDANNVPTEVRNTLPEVKRINAMRLRVMDTTAWEVYYDNRNNLVGAYVFYELIEWAETNDDLYSDEPHPHYDRIMAEYETAAPAVKNDKDIRAIVERLKRQASVKEGMSYKDFPALTYPDHKPTTLAAEITGKVSVIDFWASWCKPCHREISEELIPLYEKYKDRGLVVLGIDVDDSFSKHITATKHLGIPYRQIVDTTQNSKTLYGVSMIPQVFLISADGTMLGRFQYGDETLVPAVEKALKKE